MSLRSQREDKVFWFLFCHQQAACPGEALGLSGPQFFHLYQEEGLDWTISTMSAKIT